MGQGRDPTSTPGSAMRSGPYIYAWESFSFGGSKMRLSPTVASSAVHSKAVVLLLIHCLLLLSLCVGVMCLVLVLLCTIMSFLVLQSSRWGKEGYFVHSG